MRNAMICTSVMLALYLAWPLAFGGGHRGIETPVGAERVAAAPIPYTKPQAMAALVPVRETKPESCYSHYQRDVRLCAGNGEAACKLSAADHWDMCEATGFWPQ
jgi:hypothetical protein